MCAGRFNVANDMCVLALCWRFSLRVPVPVSGSRFSQAMYYYCIPLYHYELFSTEAQCTGMPGYLIVVLLHVTILRVLRMFSTGIGN